MTMTSTKMNAEMQKNLAKAYNEKGEPTLNWDFDALAGCGAVKSTLSDMTKWLAFQMGKTDKLEFKEYLKMMQTRRFETDVQNTAIGMGWHISETMWDRTIIWHNGGTGGYRSWAAFVPGRDVRVVVLATDARPADRLGQDLVAALAPV